jgi:hypothetical protein
VTTGWTAASVGAGVASGWTGGWVAASAAVSTLTGVADADASTADGEEAAGAQAEAKRTASAPNVERMMRDVVIKVSFVAFPDVESSLVIT